MRYFTAAGCRPGSMRAGGPGRPDATLQCATLPPTGVRSRRRRFLCGTGFHPPRAPVAEPIVVRPIAAGGALQAFDPGAGAVLVFLRRAAANPAGADDGPVAQDRHRALTQD